MRILALFASFGLAASSASALAQTSARATEPDPNQRVCRRVQPELGSRIPPRSVCMTRAEWAAQAREAQSDWQNRHKPATGNDR